jgi:hypothetical protein
MPSRQPSSPGNTFLPAGPHSLHGTPSAPQTPEQQLSPFANGYRQQPPAGPVFSPSNPSLPPASIEPTPPNHTYMQQQLSANQMPTMNNAALHYSPPIMANPMPHPVEEHEAIPEVSSIQKLLPGFAQRLFGVVVTRAQAPEPEQWSNTLKMKAITTQTHVMGWFPILALLDALGLLITAFGCAYSVATSSDGQIFLWLGLAVIFGPSFFRLLSPIASRFERICIFCSVGLFAYFTKIILSPLHFIFIDEYFHLRTIDDIQRSSHLFSENSMLVVSPLYPGLEIVTNALQTLSGIDATTAGLIIIGFSRLVMLLSLFLLYEQITKSARIAGIATMLYMTNLGFFFFNALFVYETLGLAFGALIFFILARTETVDKGGRWLLFASWITTGALVITHHVSDFFFLGFLILWAIIHKWLRQPLLKSGAASTALVGIIFSIGWVVLIAQPVIVYLVSPMNDAIAGLTSVLSGVGTARHLFADATGGHPTPIWLRLLMLFSMALTVLSVPFGALCVWHRYRYKALPLMFGLLALAYPLTQAFRVVNDPAGISDRFTPYVYIAVGFALAIFISQMWPIRGLKWRQALTITIIAVIVFLGGNMLGAGPSWTLMPGDYVVGGDAPRSIDTESIQAATWTLARLGPNNRVATDRTNRLLMGTYGQQRIITAPDDKVDISPVFYSQKFEDWQVSILQGAHVRYLEVDQRLSTSLPLQGYYFDEGEPESENLSTPISQQALTKFNTVPHINRVFDSGDIVIYDVGALVNASKKS